MTKIRIESDSESDRGKSFGGQKINVVPKKKRRSRGSSKKSSKVGNTVVYIVSDSPADAGRTFGGQKILTSKEFEERKRTSGSNTQVVSQAPTKDVRAELDKQIAAERKAAEDERIKQRETKIERIQSSGSAVEQLNERIRAGVSSEIRGRQESSNIRQTQTLSASLPINTNNLNQKIQEASIKDLQTNQPEINNFNRQQTSIGPVNIENPNQKTDDNVAGFVKGVLSAPKSILSGGKQVLIDKPSDKNKAFVDSGLAAESSNIAQVNFGEQTPSNKQRFIQNDFNKRIEDINKRYKENSDVKTFQTAAIIGTVAVGGAVAGGVSGAGAVATAVRGTGKVVSTAIDVGAVGFAGYETIKAVRNPSAEAFGVAAFAGVGGVVGGRNLIQKSGLTTQVTPISSSSEAVSLGTPGRALEIESIAARGRFNVETGFFKKKSEIVDAEASGFIQKEVRALGREDSPFFDKSIDNPISTEFSTTTVGRGELNVNLIGRGETAVDLSFIQQGNKQLIQTGKQTSASQTERVGKLNNEEIFRTVSEDVKTGDITISLSKDVNPLKPETKLSDDLISGASKSETDVFIPKKDLKTKSDDIIIDAEVTSSTPQKISLTDNRIKVELGPKKSDSKPSDTKSNPIQQEQIQIQRQSSDLTQTNKNNLSSDLRQRVSDATSQRSAKIEIRPQIVKEIIINKIKRPQLLQTAQIQRGGQFNIPGVAKSNKRDTPQTSPQTIPQIKIQEPIQKKVPIQETSPVQTQVPAIGEVFDNPQKPKNKPIQDEILRGGSPRSPPGFRPPVGPKLPPFRFNLKGFGGLNNNAAYDVYVREKGKRIKVNKEPLPENRALKTGADIVDNTVAASFQIERRGQTSSPDIPFNLGNKFTSRKTKNALKVVEKSANRIDTIGERQGLSVARFLAGRFKL